MRVVVQEAPEGVLERLEELETGLAEQQQDNDDLMACLGQESAKALLHNYAFHTLSATTAILTGVK